MELTIVDLENVGGQSYEIKLSNHRIINLKNSSVLIYWGHLILVEYFFVMKFEGFISYLYSPLFLIQIVNVDQIMKDVKSLELPNV